MKFGWTPISRPFSEAADSHEIVVVGSGYGGGVAASRLARAGRAVTVLERGREIAPGDYPRDPVKGLNEFQVSLSHTGQTLGKADGLYDIRVGDDVNVFVGCGLGGTSLINANVAIEPDPRVFGDWPEPFRSTSDPLRPWFDRARRMLGSRTYPEGKTPPKMAALEAAARGMKARHRRLDINVTFEDRHNSAGLLQAACTDCGDCVSGCNYGAKNTVLMNYLPDAKHHGAKIHTGAEVRLIARDGDGWRLTVGAPGQKATRDIRARIVILAAGTLGTNEILMRSREAGLSLSDRLGEHFSGNGDVWAFGYNANIDTGHGPDPVFGVGAGTHDVTYGPTPEGGEAFKPGPCITSMIDLRDPAAPLHEAAIVEEGAMPGALAAGYAAGFPMLDALMGNVFRYDDATRRLNDAADLGKAIMADPLSLAETAYSGPVSRTLPFLVMSHDSSTGRLALSNDRVTVDWPDAGREPAFLRDEALVRKACDAIKAEYLPNPLWQEAFNHRLVSVHPLGGCAMADSADKGVIDERCRVFDPGAGVHEGLYVVDGAAMPRGLGVNPHLTITANAERAVELMAADRGWTIDWSPARPRMPTTLPAALEFEPLAMIDRAIQAVEALLAPIDAQMWELAQMMLKGVWRNLRDMIPDLPDEETFIRFLGDPASLTTIVAPILQQALDVLRPAREAAAGKDFAGLLAQIESDLGDFSPSVTFPERMTGHLSALGVSDDPQPSDPYALAGDGPASCVFEARVSAEAVRTAVTPPDGTARISEAVFTSEALGGSFTLEDGVFRFLMPDPGEIEKWEMTYRGRLVETEAGTPRSFYLDGFKTLQRRQGSHWWGDLTRLRVGIYEDEARTRPVARGMLEVGFEDLLWQAKNLAFAYAPLKSYTDAIRSRLLKVIIGDKKKLPETFADTSFRALCVKAAILAADAEMPDAGLRQKALDLYRGKVFLRMGGLVLKSYAGIFSYMANASAEPDDTPPPVDILTAPEVFRPETEPGVHLKLTRYRGGPKGPVILAGGFGTNASSFATPTVDENIVQTLTRDGFDVWLFDYRGSGDIVASQSPFTLDDVALRDWPKAIGTVTEITGARDVQAVVHCIGSMTLFMAILAGESRVRSIVSSQLGPHAITNWMNYAKADMDLARAAAEGVPEKLWGLVDMMKLDPELTAAIKNGLPVLDPRSPGDPFCSKEFQLAVDGAVWNVPSFAPTPCYSPTCHRITAIFGPSYRHQQLNQATHDAIRRMFGPVSSAPFIHIARIMQTGHVVGADGADDYMEHPERLRLPVHFIAGGKNQEMLPEATLRTLDWLRTQNADVANLYSRTVYTDYGHMDCFIGKTAARDIFPDIRRFLNDTGAASGD